MNYYHNETCYFFPNEFYVSINRLLNPFTTFPDEKQQKIHQNKQIFSQNKAKYILFTHIASGVASGPAVPLGGTNYFQKNDEMFYSEAKITALLILKI
jgi:hypothetical protein